MPEDEPAIPGRTGPYRVSRTPAAP
jgi:hypothetical protein